MKKEVFYYRQRFLLFIYLLTSTVVTAQLENANWYFGIQTALNFNDGTSPPTLLTNSAMSTEWSSATISDDLGNLLFYTNGKSIWNASHQIMANGNNILGNTDINSAPGEAAMRGVEMLDAAYRSVRSGKEEAV